MTGSVRMEGQKGDNPLGQQAESLAEKMQEVRGEISKAIVGQAEVVEGDVVASARERKHARLRGAILFLERDHAFHTTRGCVTRCSTAYFSPRLRNVSNG